MSLNVVMNSQGNSMQQQAVRSAVQPNAFVNYPNAQTMHGTGSHVVMQGGNAYNSYNNNSQAIMQRGLASAGAVGGRKTYVGEASVPYVVGSPQRYEKRGMQALAVQPFYVEPQPQIQRVIYQQPVAMVDNSVAMNTSMAAQGNSFWQGECERLQIVVRERTQESEAWKSQCRHLESHLANLNMGDSNQVRELETRLSFSSSEITRLNAVISDISSESELWKRKCMELDGLRTLLHDKHRLEHDNGQLTAIIEDLNMKLQGLDEEKLRTDYIKRAHFQEKEFFETEIRKLHSLIESKNSEIAEWGARYTQIEIRAGATKDLECKIVMLGSEIERLHAILRTNLEEMERYQGIIQQMERSLAELRGWQAKYSEAENEILRLRESVEEWISKYSRLEYSISELRGQDSRLTALASEIERLNRTLVSKQNEIDELHERMRVSESNSSYKSEVVRLQREIEEWRLKYSRQESLLLSSRSQETTIREYENKLALLSQEIERLNYSLRSKQEEIDRLYSSSSETSRLKEMLESRNRVISDWEEKYARLEISLRELRSSESTIYDLENANSILRKEVERLKRFSEDRDNEIESWRSRYEKLEISIRDLRMNEGRISQYENKIALLSQEIERLNSMVSSYRDEIESWKARYSKLEYSQSESYEVRMREYTMKISDYENKFALLSQEIERLRSQLASRESEIESLRMRVGQYDSYTVEITNYKRSMRDFEDKIALMAQEIERLNSINKSYLADLDSWRVRYEKLEVRISEGGRYESEILYLKERIGEYENKFALLSQEIERLNNVLRTRTSESEQWSLKYKDVDMKFAMLTQEIERLRSQIASRDSDIEEWRIRYSKSESSLREYSLQQGRINEYENKIALLSQEIERLNRLLQTRSAEIDEWRLKYSKVESSSREISILQSRLSDYEGKVAMLAQEIERLNSIISSKNNELDEWRVKISRVESSTSTYQVQIRDYETKFALLSQEIERLNRMLQTRSAEIDEWRVKYSKIETSSREITILQSSIRDYEDKFAMLSQEISRLNSMLATRSKEVEEWKYKFSSVENNSSSFQYKLSEYETKIALLTQEIERQNSLLRSRMVELEEWKSKYASAESRSRDSAYSEERIRTLMSEIERLKLLSEESSSYYSRIQVLETNCQQYLMIMVLLFVEIDNLRSKLVEKEVEVENVISSTKQTFHGEGESELARSIRRVSYRPTETTRVEKRIERGGDLQVTKELLTTKTFTSTVSGGGNKSSFSYK